MKFRSLTPFEIEVLIQALERLLLQKLVAKDIRVGAQSMLDQKMPENFLWRQE